MFISKFTYEILTLSILASFDAHDINTPMWTVQANIVLWFDKLYKGLSWWCLEMVYTSKTRFNRYYSVCHVGLLAHGDFCLRAYLMKVIQELHEIYTFSLQNNLLTRVKNFLNNKDSWELVKRILWTTPIFRQCQYTENKLILVHTLYQEQ